ncbi:TetR/AcrR family transcriptional regulator [Salicibibacter cibarius]|uniref:TetR/AcrR family transcriptional regulator n=2 Tax=Salicibibacter cibarius TaxID=2743000 RepID=A0A7T6Z749_9BACI|nr:TetR/AcrR family transcriptional regulator [Salicibibacter cibarius]
MGQYFVDATIEIIEQEGIKSVTIRKIADKVGYNSATIYNYFQELSHLIFFAALRYLTKYIEELPFYMEKGENSLHKYLLSWECFCKHSFKNPQVYYAIFLANLGERPEELLEYYYNVYQDEVFGDLTEDIRTLIVEYHLSKRSRNELEQSVQDGYLKENDLEVIKESTVLIWQGMLTTVLNNRRNYNAEEAANTTMKHVREIINNYTLV